MPCPVGGRMSRFGKLGKVGASELESHLAYRCSFGGRWNWWRIFIFYWTSRLLSGPEKIHKNYRTGPIFFPEQKIAIQRNGICCCCFFFCETFRLGPNFLGFFRIQETEARNVDEEIKSLRRTETDLRRAIAAHRRWRKTAEITGEFS